MAQDTNVEHGSTWQRIKDAWPIITFCVGISLAIGGSWFNMRMAQATTLSAVTVNARDIAENKLNLSNRAPKFTTDAQFQRINDTLEKHSDKVEALEDDMNDLSRSSDRIDAKIELEVEKLRNELKQQAADQSNVLQQILREVQQGTD